MLRLLPFLLMFSMTANAADTTVFYNGHIRIFDRVHTHAHWIAVSQGKVTAWGRGKQYEMFNPSKKVDLGKRFVLPSLTDSHAHITDMGRALTEINLKGTQSTEEAVKLVLAFSNKPTKNHALVGGGWDQSNWGGKYPTRTLLDAVSMTRPIVLYRIGGHAAWVNTYALKKTPLWEMSTDPEGGKILRDAKGLPTGVLLDNAMEPLKALLPPPSDKMTEYYVRAAVQQALQFGITSVHDAGTTAGEIEVIRRMLAEKKIQFRFYEMLSEEAFLKKTFKKVVEINKDNQLTVRTVKLFADGAMGSHGAALDQPYQDDPKNKGILLTDLKTLIKKIQLIDSKGFQIAVHAIGDRANQLVLDAIEKVMGLNAKTKRPRIEHAQLMRPQDIERAGRLGVVLSMQPQHCTSDMKWVEKRLGKTRSRFAYAWKSVVKAKAPLAFGSDGPYDSFNPWHGITAAITRVSFEFPTPKVFVPEEKLNREQAFNAYTMGAAYASFSERSLGNLEHGKWADFIVLDKDPFQLDAKEIRDLKVSETYIAGEKVWPEIPRG